MAASLILFIYLCVCSPCLCRWNMFGHSSPLVVKKKKRKGGGSVGESRAHGIFWSITLYLLIPFDGCFFEETQILRRPLRRISRIACSGFSDLLNCRRESCKWMILFCGEDKAKLKRRRHLKRASWCRGQLPPREISGLVLDLGFGVWERESFFYLMNYRLVPADAWLQPRMHTRDCVVFAFLFLFFLSEPERKKGQRGPPPVWKVSMWGRRTSGHRRGSSFSLWDFVIRPFPPHGWFTKLCLRARLSVSRSVGIPPGALIE